MKLKALIKELKRMAKNSEELDVHFHNQPIVNNKRVKAWQLWMPDNQVTITIKIIEKR